jgi:hypothetical protein
VLISHPSYSPDMPWRVPPPCGRDDAARSHLGTKRAAVLRNIAAAEQERRQDPVKTNM